MGGVLLQDATHRVWAAEDRPGSCAQTDWQQGSTARLLDPSRSGMLARVVVSRRPETTEIEHDGLVVEGEEDTDSATARVHRGGKQVYRPTPTSDGTHPATAADTGEEHHDGMSVTWDRALEKVQELDRDRPRAHRPSW